MSTGREAFYLAILLASVAVNFVLVAANGTNDKNFERAVDRAAVADARAATWVDVATVYHGTALNWQATADNWRAVYLSCDMALDGYRRIFELPSMPHVPPLRPLEAVEAPRKEGSP